LGPLVPPNPLLSVCSRGEGDVSFHIERQLLRRSDFHTRAEKSVRVRFDINALVFDVSVIVDIAFWAF
jgi:hypothetical protein